MLTQRRRLWYNIHATLGQWEPWLKLGGELVPFNCYVFVWKLTAHLDPYPAKLIYLNFQPLEVVSRYRDPQLQVAENYSYLFNFITEISNLDV